MRTYLDLFGENYDMYEEHENKHQYFTIANKGYDERLQWLTADIKNKFNTSSSRIEMYRKYEALFKGVHYKSMDYRRNENDDSYSGTKQPRMAVNFCQEMVEAKVAQRSRFKPAIAVLPNNDEINDINNAKTVKMLLDNRSQEIDIEKVFADGDRMNFLRGESFTFVTWDRDAGHVHPEYAKVQKMGQQVPVLDKEGNPTGEFYTMPIMVGDVKVEVLGPERVFVEQNKTNWNEVDHITVMDWKHVDELKAEYPEHAETLKETDEFFFYDSSDFGMKKRKNHVAVFTFYHRKTKFVPNGAMIKYVSSAILEEGPLPYSHGKLPCVFDTDIDVPDELHGRPFLTNIAQLQNLHNMCMASIARNLAVSSMPKWVMPKGAVHRDKLNNEYGIIEYSGPVAPQMVTYSGLNKDLYEMPDKVERYIEKGSAVYGISRGEPPKGIKAAVALQFLDEQETQRESRGMAKRQRRILDTYRMMISTMGDYYKPEDGRMIRILGQDNSYLMKSFTQADFNCAYDVRLLNSSALPDSKAGKISAILDINTATQADPMFGKEEIAQMLDLANDERFKDRAAVSVKAAETVCWKILNREPVQEPQEWDDFIVMYPIVLKTLQERTYKETEQDIVQALKQYIMVMEGLMWQKSMKNPMFAAQMQRFYMFPVLFTIPPMMPMAPQMPQAPNPGVNTQAVAQSMIRNQGEQ